MPFKKKKYNSRFPVGRIKKIIRTDEDIGKVAQAVPVIISKTLELFLESLIKKSLEVSRMKNSRVLGPHHMKQCIFSERRFDFLRDLVKDVPEVSQEDDSYDENNHHPSRRESNDDEMNDKDDYNSDTDSGDEDM